MTLNKSLPLSGPHFSHVENKDNNPSLSLSLSFLLWVRYVWHVSGSTLKTGVIVTGDRRPLCLPPAIFLFPFWGFAATQYPAWAGPGHLQGRDPRLKGESLSIAALKGTGSGQRHFLV